MTPTTILDLARQIDQNIQTNHITVLQGGFSSQAYKVDPGNRDPFVLLVQRSGGISKANYAHAYVVLSLLDKHQYAPAPKPVWLANDHQALAITLFDGVASDTFQFDGQIDQEQLAMKVIDSLLDTATITIEEYEAYAKDFGITQAPVHTASDGAQQYGVEWLETVKQSCPDREIIAWLEPRVQQSVAIAKTIDTGKPIFGHGDPSNPNILIQPDGSFMLIDWDSARFHTYGAEFFVAYTTHLTDFMKPYRQKLITHTANRLGVPEEEFGRTVTEFRRYTEVFDVNWAAMMMAKVHKGEAEGDIEHFRSIARERIAIYEQSFGSN